MCNTLLYKLFVDSRQSFLQFAALNTVHSEYLCEEYIVGFNNIVNNTSKCPV
jgi:hypothetical protein